MAKEKGIGVFTITPGQVVAIIKRSLSSGRLLIASPKAYIQNLVSQTDSDGPEFPDGLRTNIIKPRSTSESVDLSAPMGLKVLTGTQAAALTPSDGWVYYDSTDNKAKVYSNGSWVNLH